MKTAEILAATLGVLALGFLVWLGLALPTNSGPGFWEVHGVWFLLGLTFFPRITTLFFVLTPFGWLAWLGWIFTPSLLVAVLATSHYWHTNPVLCVLAWLVFAGKMGGSGSASTKKERP